METRATLRPGQKGTQKLLERYGERLVCVRYRYDAKACRQYKTVELIVSSAACQPFLQYPQRRAPPGSSNSSQDRHRMHLALLPAPSWCRSANRYMA